MRLSVHDARSFELAWSRIPNAVTYHVQVGSRTVQENGAISRFVGNADLSRGFDYILTALDRAGRALATQRFRVQLASAAQLVASGGGTGTPTTPTDPMAPVTPPNPTGGPIRTGTSTIGGDIPVRLAVYDARSYELFWERVPGAATYRLSRGGRVVQESNAVSRFVTGVNGTASFAYTLVALDRSGNALRSTSFTVSPSAATQLVLGTGTTAPTTPTNPTTPPAPTGGLPQAEAGALDRILALVNGDAVEKLTAFALRVRAGAPTLVATGRTASVTIPGVGRDVATVEYRCRDGGTATVADPNPARTVVIYAGCRVGPLTANGRAESSTPAAAPVFNPGPIPPPFAGTVPFEMQLRDGFTLDDARDGSSISVRAMDSYERAELGGATARFSTFWSSVDLQVTGPGGTVTSARAQGDVVYFGTPGAADGQPFFVVQSINADFDATFSGPLGAVSIGMPRAFELDRAAGPFPNGTLAVAGQGVSYELDAGNGDPATFQLNVARDGSTAAYTVPWSDRFELEPFRPDRADLGF